MGFWEQINNPNFKVVEFDHFKSQAGLPNIESMNAEFIRMTLPQNERMIKLDRIAINQLKSLTQNTTLKNLK